MREMRRSDRMITDREEIVDVLDSCKVFRMAVHDEEGMYMQQTLMTYLMTEQMRLFLQMMRQLQRAIQRQIYHQMMQW